jgi:hypothetical protein
MQEYLRSYQQSLHDILQEILYFLNGNSVGTVETSLRYPIGPEKNPIAIKVRFPIISIGSCKVHPLISIGFAT